LCEISLDPPELRSITSKIGGDDGFAIRISRTVEQDDKVSIAALSLGSTSTVARTSGAHGESELGHGAKGAVVRRASAMEPETQTSSHSPASELADEAAEDVKASGTAKSVSGKTPNKASNNVRKIRIERMMSKAELARRANLSVLTIDRVERGYGCRVDTKRKILEALGLSLADRVRVFGEEE
jgi:DNA-binding XRE family transcriptional regulator